MSTRLEFKVIAKAPESLIHLPPDADFDCPHLDYRLRPTTCSVEVLTSISRVHDISYSLGDCISLKSIHHGVQNALDVQTGRLSVVDRDNRELVESLIVSSFSNLRDHVRFS